jgi:hypothetical protein
MGLNQQAILDVARRAVGIRFEGEYASLRFLRRQVALNVESYVRESQDAPAVINNIHGGFMNTIQMGNVTASGESNVTIATNIDGSFNKAADAGGAGDMRARLQALTVAVAKLAARLPEKDAKRVTSDLGLLTSESISSHPRRERYQLSARKIIAAAESVADMVAPITAAVSDVMSLLGG